jgi:hypothetical protein
VYIRLDVIFRMNEREGKGKADDRISQKKKLCRSN